MRRRLAILSCLLAAWPAAAAAAPRGESSLEQSLAAALRVPHVPAARSGAAVLDLDTGEVVFRQRASLGLAPASTEKLVLSYALLSALGPTFRIETTAQAAGERAGTTLRGDLFLVGGGDPTLSRADLAALAQQVRAAGIRRLEGRLLGDETLFDTRRTAPGWKASFYLGESPPLSALVVDRARHGSRVTQAPALAATSLFRDALRSAGVVVAGSVGTGAAPADGETVGVVRSAPLGALVAEMDLESDNFIAEMLLKQLALLQAPRGSTAAGAQTVMRLLGADGIPLAGVRFVDGSGLSLRNRLTADALVAVLEAIWDNPVLQPVLLRALPVAGRSGTLRDRMRAPPLRGNVRAKTGTTSRASALAGYVKRKYVFAVLQNGSPLSSWWARRAQDRFTLVLARQPAR